MFVVGNPLNRGNTSVRTHTQVQKHREQRHVRENKDLLCMSYRFSVFVCAFVHGCVCPRLKVAEEAG